MRKGKHMEYQIKVNLPSGEQRVIMLPAGRTWESVASEVATEYDAPIVLATVNGKLRELGKEVTSGAEVSFHTMTSSDGKRTYRRSVVLLMQKAVSNVCGPDIKVRVCHSLGQGYFCEILNKKADKDAIEVILGAIREEMHALVEQDIIITKHSVKTEEAEAFFHKQEMYDKEKLFYYRRSSRVNLYELGGFMDYFYGYMVPSTGYLKYFELETYDTGFVLRFPNKVYNVVEPLETSMKLHKTMQTSREWSRTLGVGCVGELNEAICNGRGQDLILTAEALMEARIGELADEIVKRDGVKFVMIAGPSSSGKTSFANRLSIQLTARGLQPHPISLDDYYADREFCPRNPDGSYDFECLEALDVEGFNQDMAKLLRGETVDMPSFNFKTGKREYRGHMLTLGEDDVLVIEGIHGLNDKMSYLLPAESKFRIYISALTQLNIDEHNPLPTTDGRLIRRMVRDARTRGTSAQETIAMWPSVRKGEEQNIFPFQESADVVFNSALVYELAALKVFAEPLLFQIPRDSKEYPEAKRLLKFLDYFLPLPNEGITHNSLVREFVGGSCFNV